MKIQRLIALCLLASFSAGAAAQDIVNIRTNPFMVFGSFINLDVDFRLGDQHSLGPMLTANVMEPEFLTGLRYTYYERGTFQQGWMLAAYAVGGQEVAERVFDPVTSVETEQTDWLAKVGINQGYLWRWDTFNLGLGLGANLVYQNYSDKLSLNSDLHFSIGWAR